MTSFSIISWCDVLHPVRIGTELKTFVKTAPGLILSLKTKQIRSKALTLKPDHYYHFGVTYHDGDVCLYLDGEPVGKGIVPPGPVELNWDLAIGEDLAGGPNEQLRGNVDDVLFLGRTMSDAEVKALSARRRH